LPSESAGKLAPEFAPEFAPELVAWEELSP
jgi:hypothetical protein